MKFSTFIHLGAFFALFILFSCCLTACKQQPSAKTYAQRLCTCYDPASEPTTQLNAGKIDRATYEQLIIECMGTDDPLKLLEDNPTALLQFKADFLEALQENCPVVARRLGY